MSTGPSTGTFRAGAWRRWPVPGWGWTARLEKGADKKGHPREAHWDFQTMEMATAYAEGIVLMGQGDNASQVLESVQKAVAELNRTGLPDGIQIEPFYDRNHLVQDTLRTVSGSALLGIALVVLVLLLFMGRPVLVGLVALAIPFALLFALVLMKFVNIPIGLLSVGAIDIGIIVAGSVIMADSIADRLGTTESNGVRRDLHRAILLAARDVERPVFFSILIIIAAYLPLLSLTRIEGLLFRPMALLLLLLVPFAFVGGAIALDFRGMNMNFSTRVGFAALFGVALMNGVLMVLAITNFRSQGLPVDKAIVEGALSRLRPILMTALVAMLGLLPASLATGLGADVQRPLATVIVWGLFSAMLVTLFVLPVFYRLFLPALPPAIHAAPAEHLVEALKIGLPEGA